MYSMDTVVLSQLPQECSFLPPGPNSTRRSWHFPPASTQLLLDFLFFKVSFQVLCLAGSEPVATKHGPWYQDSAAQQRGQEQSSLWHSASSLQGNLCGTVSKSFFLLVQLGIISYLTIMMWGLRCCASYGKGGPWMESPTDEQRIVAISGCDST